MKIDGFGSITSTNATTKRRGASAAGNFADLLAAAESDETGQTTQASDIPATAPLNNLLALQEISDDHLQRKKLVQQGNNILDTLEKLRRQLLSGSLSLSVLRDIEHEITQQKQAVADPQLNALISDIELRAAVELAKLQQAINTGN